VAVFGNDGTLLGEFECPTVKVRYRTHLFENFFPVLRIRIHMFLVLPDPDPLVGVMDPDPSITLLGEFECPTVNVPTQ
jgi:hypothetical protein